MFIHLYNILVFLLWLCVHYQAVSKFRVDLLEFALNWLFWEISSKILIIKCMVINKVMLLRLWFKKNGIFDKVFKNWLRNCFQHLVIDVYICRECVLCVGIKSIYMCIITMYINICMFQFQIDIDFYYAFQKSKFQFRSKFKLKFCFKYTVWYCSYAIFCMFVTYMVFFFKYMNVYTLFQCIKFTAFLCINFIICLKNFTAIKLIFQDFIEILKYLSLTFELT